MEAARVILQKNLTQKAMVHEIQAIINQDKIKEKMEKNAAANAKPAAAKEIVKDILKQIGYNAEQ
jgi:UDP-N-acetylglucosamine:LPS N-acetylglucosamine transferase